MVEREGGQIQPAACSPRAREVLRFEAWSARLDDDLAALRSSRARPLPRKQLDVLCAAHIVVRRLVCRLSEVPTTQDAQDLERAWRDLEGAWAAVRSSSGPGS